MKPAVRYTLAALGGLLLLAIFALWRFSVAWSADYIDQSNGPTTREEALPHLNVPLPLNASNIQYASLVTGLQGSRFYVRFEGQPART